MNKQAPNNWISRIKFQQLLIATVSFGILMLALLSIFVSTSLSSQSFRERLGQEGLSLAETFAERSRVALLYRSGSDAKYVAEAMMAFPDVLGVAVYDDTKKQLYGSGDALTGVMPGWIWPNTTSLDHETNELWHFVAPVYTGSQADADSPFLAAEMAPELIGYVRIQMGKTSLRQMETDIFRYNIAASGLLAAVLLAILLAITNRITKPLHNLAENMRRAREGDKDVRAEVKGTRDVIEMKMAFNSMMEAISSREAELRSTRDMALEAARVKGEFAANVSHELRTPLNGVLGMLELLSDMGLSNKQNEYVEIASGSAESLLSLIDDILDFSKIDSGKFEVASSQFDLRDLLEEIVTLLGPQAQRKDIDIAYLLEPGVPTRLSGDCGRLRQVLINLIGNALKFTERGEVGIEVSVTQLQGNTARLRFNVFDTGIGMEQSIQDRIFEAFSQADGSTTRKYGGTGLGLAISRQLVEVLDGEIGVESEPGEGSSFWFILPFDIDAGECNLTSLPAADADLPKVLVVDDSRLNRRYIGHVLGQERLAYEVATSGLEALDRLRVAARQNTPFDLVIIDELMPGIKGTDLAHLINNDSAVANVRIIMMVNRANPSYQDKEKLNLAGMLSKPVQRKELIGLLSDLEQFAAQSVMDSLPQDEDAEVASFDGSTVLVVEDNRANQLVALGMLERMGCKATIANNGLEALELIGREQFDLVLMDCHMPEMDGYEATAQIRRLESGPNELPIVAMTANVQKGEDEKCLAVGMSDYLPKPLTLDELRNKISRWLQVTHYPALSTDSSLADCEDACGEEIIDHRVIRELGQHMGAALNTMIGVFLDDLPTYLRSLRDAASVQDSVAIADIAHTIKGAAGNFGARRLTLACKQLESDGRAGNLEASAELVEQVVRECGLLQQALEGGFLKNAQAGNSQVTVGSDNEDEVADLSSSELLQEQRILIVDDDRGMRFAMRKVLEKDGYRVDEVSNGEQALIYCERFMPDLVLMDAIMPEMDGFKACAEIQGLPCGKGLPVLIITALNDEASIGRAFAAGAIDYISKPVNFAVLRKRIARILQACRAEKHIHQLAYNDTLTGLPNRTLFTERLSEILAAESPDELTALLFLDLDRFKLVNDTFGHDAGDLLLKVVAERLLGCIRQGDIVSRFGGDEFTILLHRAKTAGVVRKVAAKIQQTLSRPFVFLGKELHVTTSIGIAMSPRDGSEIGALLKNADIAMYRAKTQGDCYEFYDKTMEVDVARRLGIENDLRGAIKRGEMEVYYQPQQELGTDKLIGMEALVRWEHPTRGLVMPGDFIPLAEETGQIVELGEWVMRTACAQLKSWLDQGHPRIRVAVNLAGRQLDSADIAQRTAAILEAVELDPELLELEITESTIMEDAESVIGTLQELKDMGVMLAVDDFGTGYSSLNYLKRFPIDMLKIDRAFVSDITTDKVDADIVTTIIALAHSLGVKVIAEGVEDSLQKKFLKTQGCDYIQGYHISKPIPADVFEAEFLRKKISAA